MTVEQHPRYVHTYVQYVYVRMCNIKVCLFDHRNSTWYVERLAVDCGGKSTHMPAVIT